MHSHAPRVCVSRARSCACRYHTVRHACSGGGRAGRKRRAAAARAAYAQPATSGTLAVVATWTRLSRACGAAWRGATGPRSRPCGRVAASRSPSRRPRRSSGGAGSRQSPPSRARARPRGRPTGCARYARGRRPSPPPLRCSSHRVACAAPRLPRGACRRAARCRGTSPSTWRRRRRPAATGAACWRRARRWRGCGAAQQARQADGSAPRR
mmetsp:Transcript_74446/g.205182  ORF Transcript_74446/g.205182 Transcript_74446/m.205182 type:complete len:211 (-) Transcript_74446:644-1276(-)